MNIGFIGIGNMGGPMAANLARKGFAVTVYDNDAARAARFGQEHDTGVAETLARLGENDVIVTMLPTGPIVTRVLLGDAEAGEPGLLASLRPGTVVIDMSSSEPVGTQELGAALRKEGVYLVDAPVSGGVPRAQSGELAIMYGGDDVQAIERVLPVLSAMGTRLFATGPLGSGHAMKALNNYVAAAGFAACAEALIIGKRFGLDAGNMVDIMNVSTGRNFHTDLTLKEHVVGEKYATGFAIGLLAKDVRIAAELGRAVGVDAPVSRLVCDRWAQARDALGAERDNSAAILAWSPA
ncbi:NAD(P)-dependent oxidoreductase [Chitinasiproducens palmae]|uniref:3-hydroxyisobutyrate dehydrogenase n=1 Tax=Chitinasiproducens palmae TaxID=1770053 RepID=A0A1H2PUV3_9BURK|nr:NAD(P)-dependent oxidoreductase [Chitinasiproducens palmae]SDV50574.1 3-hydroxyisobutyrate dehydrogenase [Chitinasiproducens palmae]